MQEYLTNTINTFNEDSKINKIVYNIITVIKTTHDYESAINLIKQNNIKLEDIVSRSIRLPLADLIHLADLMILKKGNK
ncbi:hypothetical protein CRV01_12285 [Arcobacter sp. CECT 8983]|uniref:hypothetical protein n=1 Tax=Arcobacter sp. CECT 8983 TaxID=2044508 RepID=UPI00100BC931|nr:hypothetical protein [Arcobacter sp. CECT 8983]RXJ88520.1 hypothetical protein CRV01_12285 [Arcobacter sp. CECT 8983]